MEMEITQYVRVELLVLVPVLWAIGKGLKQFKALNNAWIPVMLAGAGVLLAVAYLLVFPSELNVQQAVLTGIIQGVLCTTLAVYGHQVFKQITELTQKGKE